MHGTPRHSPCTVLPPPPCTSLPPSLLGGGLLFFFAPAAVALGANTACDSIAVAVKTHHPSTFEFFEKNATIGGRRELLAYVCYCYHSGRSPRAFHTAQLEACPHGLLDCSMQCMQCSRHVRQVPVPR